MNLDADFFKRRFEYLLDEPQHSYRSIHEKLGWCIDQKLYIDTVLVSSGYLSLAAHLLEGTGIRTAAGISYPLGSLPIELAIHEAQEDILEGAQQVELVLPAGRIRGGEQTTVQSEVQEFCECLGPVTTISLVANLALLDYSEKTWCMLLAARLGVGLRTNTGYESNESIADILLAHQTVQNDLVVTACGGVNTAELAIDLMQAGATRIATFQLPEVITGLEYLIQMRKENHP